MKYQVILLYTNASEMINNYIQFISNVKGLQSLEKRTKVFEYLKKKCISNNEFMFLQEMHSTVYDEKRWQDQLKGKRFFSYRHRNSCRVAIGF